jgi:hypothetical protein
MFMTKIEKKVPGVPEVIRIFISKYSKIQALRTLDYLQISYAELKPAYLISIFCYLYNPY